MKEKGFHIRSVPKLAINGGPFPADNITTSDISLFFDFVKSVGILGVFCYHYYGAFMTVVMNISSDSARLVLLNGLFKTAVNGTQAACVASLAMSSFGGLGVYLFIVASGFGLYNSSLRKKTAWSIFYKKRIIRVLPQYYFFLFLTFLIAIYINHMQFYSSPEGLINLLQHLLLVQTLSRAYSSYGHFYFVAIIFQLYLLFPFFSKIMSSNRLRVPFFIISFFLSFLLNKLLAATGLVFTGLLITDYVPYFLFGMLIAEALYHRRSLSAMLFDYRLSISSFLLAGALMVSVVAGMVNYSRVTVPLAFASFLSLLPFFLLLQKMKVDPAIRLFSYCSYSFYLIHRIVYINILQTRVAAAGVASNASWVILGLIILGLTTLAAYFIQRSYDSVVTYIGHRGMRPEAVN